MIAKGNLLHYLNAGDLVYANPYQYIKEPCLLKTKVMDVNSGISWFDRPKLFGFAYCHQGLIFSKDHEPYERVEFKNKEFSYSHPINKIFWDGYKA